MTTLYINSKPYKTFLHGNGYEPLHTVDLSLLAGLFPSTSERRVIIKMTSEISRAASILNSRNMSCCKRSKVFYTSCARGLARMALGLKQVTYIRSLTSSLSKHTKIGSMV